MFKTELHCHSNDVSECARVDVDTIMKRYLEGGYSTLVLTNHFNETTSNRWGCQSWDEFIDRIMLGYNKLKEASNGRIEILLGIELRFTQNVNDYLVFGITESFLREHEYIYKMTPESFSALARENGLLFIQAHPFRNSMTVINPKYLDGVEVFNGHFGHDSRNEIANMWAEKFGLIKTSGTDFHYADVPTNAGILTEKKITSMEMLVDILKSGKYELIRG
jgi:predicted metal-dependent phosphoesterase TrpH